MVGLPDGKQILRICSAVSREYQRVTDKWTDELIDGQILGWHVPRYAYASRGKNGRLKIVKQYGETHPILISQIQNQFSFCDLASVNLIPAFTPRL